MTKQLFLMLSLSCMVNGVFADNIENNLSSCEQEGNAFVIQFTGDASECHDDYQIHINEEIYQDVDKIYINHGIYNRTHLKTQEKQDNGIAEKCDKVILGLEKISLGLENLSLRIQKCVDEEIGQFNDIREGLSRIGKIGKSNDVKVKANLNARMTSRAYAARKAAAANKK